MSEILEIKVLHADPNYNKIFDFNIDEYKTLAKAGVTENSTEEFPDVSGFSIVATQRPNLYLLQYELDKSPSEKGQDYDIVRLSYNTEKKNKKSSSKDYCIGGMMYNPDSGHMYLAHSPLDIYLPLVDGKAIFQDILWEEVVSGTIQPFSTDIEKSKQEFFDSLSDLKSLDTFFQKIKFFSANKVKDSSGDTEGIDVTDFLIKKLGGTMENPFTESTILGSLVAFKKLNNPDPDDTQNQTLKSSLESEKFSETNVSLWLNFFINDIFKASIYYTKLFSLLANCEIPKGQINSMVMKSAQVASKLGILNIDLLNPVNNIVFDKLLKDVDLLNANPLYNAGVRENLSIHMDKFYSLEQDGAEPDELNKDTIHDWDKDIDKHRKEVNHKVAVANITDFTAFNDDAGLNGSVVMPESDAKDYNYLIDHLEKNKSVLDAARLSFDSLKTSIKNVVASKIVKPEVFNNIINSIQNEENIVPVITFLTKQISNALTIIYRGFNKAIKK